ncbi:acyl-CoA carboxylase subunit epsilon [Streptomyces rochei]
MAARREEGTWPNRSGPCPLCASSAGRAGAEELAALTAVLYALMARRDEGPGGRERSGAARWRPGHRAGAYRSPYCWR